MDFIEAYLRSKEAAGRDMEHKDRLALERQDRLFREEQAVEARRQSDRQAQRQQESFDLQKLESNRAEQHRLSQVERQQTLDIAGGLLKRDPGKTIGDPSSIMGAVTTPDSFVPTSPEERQRSIQRIEQEGKDTELTRKADALDKFIFSDQFAKELSPAKRKQLMAGAMFGIGIDLEPDEKDMRALGLRLAALSDDPADQAKGRKMIAAVNSMNQTFNPYSMMNFNKDANTDAAATSAFNTVYNELRSDNGGTDPSSDQLVRGLQAYSASGRDPSFTQDAFQKSLARAAAHGGKPSIVDTLLRGPGKGPVQSPAPTQAAPTQATPPAPAAAPRPMSTPPSPPGPSASAGDVAWNILGPTPWMKSGASTAQTWLQRKLQELQEKRQVSRTN